MRIQATVTVQVMVLHHAPATLHLRGDQTKLNRDRLEDLYSTTQELAEAWSLQGTGFCIVVPRQA